MSDGLTSRARELLEVLRKSDIWLTRGDLAQLIGKAELVPYDVELLERLVDKGLIEVRQGHLRKAGRSSYEYKAKR